MKTAGRATNDSSFMDLPLFTLSCKRDSTYDTPTLVECLEPVNNTMKNLFCAIVIQLSFYQVYTLLRIPRKAISTFTESVVEPDARHTRIGLAIRATANCFFAELPLGNLSCSLVPCVWLTLLLVTIRLSADPVLEALLIPNMLFIVANRYYNFSYIFL